MKKTQRQPPLFVFESRRPDRCSMEVLADNLVGPMLGCTLADTLKTFLIQSKNLKSVILYAPCWKFKSCGPFYRAARTGRLFDTVHLAPFPHTKWANAQTARVDAQMIVLIGVLRPSLDLPQKPLPLAR